MKNHYLLLIALLTVSLVACSPRITRTAAFNTAQKPATPTAQTNVSLQTPPSTASTTSSGNAQRVSLASTPTVSNTTSSNPTATTIFRDNPATFTHSNTVPRGTPPSINNYADYDDYLAAYYDHYGRDALVPPVPAIFHNQASTVTSIPSSNQVVRPASLPPTTPVTIPVTTPIRAPVETHPVGVQSAPSASPTTSTSSTTTTVVTTQPISNDAYHHAINQANQAVTQANAALAQAAQAQQQIAPPIQPATQPTTQSAANVTTASTSTASSVASPSGMLAGTWQGAAVDNIRGTRTGTQLILTQRNNQLGGEVYFETVNGLEFFGQLQGRLAGNNATMTLRYQDGSYTYFTGDFGASFFTGEYQYITSGGQSLASGTVRLRRQ